MASLMNELLEVLENEEAGYRELVEASTRKKEVIIKADIRALEEITADNASPLVLKVKAELRGFPELEMTSYNNWKVKEIKEKK